ncbi:hypothetical protein ACIRD3_04990 [Kitasatospora sp. NPDC093550]|uniref:hypothetical protein n=1 Tax=Kitasatospora sp. NPDC093550 TaxID=3364089 RepID=UPI0038294BD8
MTSVRSTAGHPRAIRPTTAPRRPTEPRAHVGAAAVAVVPLWAAPCALAPQGAAKR